MTENQFWIALYIWIGFKLQEGKLAEDQGYPYRIMLIAIWPIMAVFMLISDIFDL